jgi:hypothetical protein
MKMAAFWDVAPCSLVWVDRRFRGAYCPYQQGGGAISQKAVICKGRKVWISNWALFCNLEFTWSNPDQAIVRTSILRFPKLRQLNAGAVCWNRPRPLHATFKYYSYNHLTIFHSMLTTAVDAVSLKNYRASWLSSLTVLHSIREVPGSSLETETSYPDRIFVAFVSPTRKMPS